MRLISCMLALWLVCQLSALESPLIIHGQGDLTCNINPNTGIITLYRSNGQQLIQTGSHYFATDIREQSLIPAKGFADRRSLLREGQNTKPNTLNLIKQKSKTAWQVMMTAEDEFWSDTPVFDGVISGAMGLNHIFLCVPSCHSLFVYEIENGNCITLKAVRNIGPDLMIGSVLNSDPKPKELLKQLPQDVQDAFNEQVRLREEAIAQGDIPPLKPLKPWVQSLRNEKIVILEPANKKLLVYEMKQQFLELNSARNLEIELMVPPNISVHSKPNINDQYKSYMREMKQQRVKPYSIDELRALVQVAGNFKQDGQDDDIQASIDANYFLSIDFTQARKLLLYNPDEGGKGITLYSVRDYTLENGITLHRDRIKRERAADKYYSTAKDLASKRRQRTRAMDYLRLSLEYKPALHIDAEEKLARHLSGEDHWAEIIKTARENHQQLLKQKKARQDLLESGQL